MEPQPRKLSGLSVFAKAVQIRASPKDQKLSVPEEEVRQQVLEVIAIQFPFSLLLSVLLPPQYVSIRTEIIFKPMTIKEFLNGCPEAKDLIRNYGVGVGANTGGDGEGEGLGVWDRGDKGMVNII